MNADLSSSVAPLGLDRGSAAPLQHAADGSRRPMDDLTGKVAVVTGAASGIGRAIALAYVHAGAQVVAADVDDAGLEATRALAELPQQLLTRQVDVSDPDGVASLVRAAVDEFGALTTLVNNAAVSLPGSVTETSLEDFDRTMAVNVRGYFLGCKLAIPAMLEAGGGSIVNMGSVNSLMAERLLSSYCVSKGAVLMLTKSVALDYAAHGIRCNCICPGWVDTPINLAHADRLGGLEEIRRTLPDWMPVAREGRPDEIAAMAVFLASDMSRFATGASFVVDGGMTAGL